MIESSTLYPQSIRIAVHSRGYYGDSNCGGLIYIFFGCQFDDVVIEDIYNSTIILSTWSAIAFCKYCLANINTYHVRVQLI